MVGQVAGEGVGEGLGFGGSRLVVGHPYWSQRWLRVKGWSQSSDAGQPASVVGLHAVAVYYGFTAVLYGSRYHTVHGPMPPFNGRTLYGRRAIFSHTNTAVYGRITAVNQACV